MALWSWRSPFLRFSAINTASPNLAVVGSLLVADCIVNVALLLVAAKFTKRYAVIAQ